MPKSKKTHKTDLRVVLIDGNALVHRAYHALPPLTSPSGELTNAVFGFTTIMLKAMEDLKPDALAVAWDSSETKTFRHKLSDEYKATRQKADPELYEQFPRVKQVVTTLGFPVIELAGYEADDIIATIAKRDLKSDEVIVVTGDMDALQLVDDHITVYSMRRGFTDTVRYDAKAVEERYAIRPDQVVDYKALRGDTSDNIPGVPGIGEKSAVLLLAQFDSLDNLYKNLHLVPDKWRKKLEEHKDSAFLSQKLAQMVLDTPIKPKPDPDDWRVGEFDYEEAAQLFQELGFRSLLTKIPKSKLAPDLKIESKQAKASKLKTETITTEAQLDALTSALKKATIMAFDTETDSLDSLTAGLVGVCLSLGDAKEGYYIPVGHTEGTQLSPGTVAKALQPYFLSKKLLKVAHNLKFDMQVLENAGIELAEPYADTMLMGYLLSSNSRPEKLDDLALAEFGYQMQPISELIGTGRNQKSFADVPIADAGFYGAEDAILTLRLYHALLPKLKKEKLEKVMDDLETPLVGILSKMERRGIELDVNFLKSLSGEMEKLIRSCEKRIYKDAGKEFNIASPAQLGQILFQDLEIPTAGMKKLQKGYSTAASELEKMRGLHPIVEHIFEYRELTKLKSTYVDTLPGLVDKDSRVHTDYSQAVAATGRLSSSNPNLQNIPIRTETGRRIRQAFVAPKGRLLVSADYSQLEIRIVAHMCQEKSLIAAFKGGEDIHTMTAALVAGVKEEDVTPEMRRAAKAVNFGIMYGLSPHGLSVGTGMSREDAAKFIDNYFAQFPRLRDYMTETIEKARKVGYAESLFGRRRYLPELHASNYVMRAAAERMAINMPVQGTASDIIKKAMISIDPKIEKSFPKAKMLLQVHDELVFETDKGSEEKLAEFVAGEMSSAFKLEVPLTVDVKSGHNWAQMKEIYRSK
jgi:DNA polymerase-1